MTRVSQKSSSSFISTPEKKDGSTFSFRGVRRINYDFAAPLVQQELSSHQLQAPPGSPPPIPKGHVGQQRTRGVLTKSAGSGRRQGGVLSRGHSPPSTSQGPPRIGTEFRPLRVEDLRNGATLVIGEQPGPYRTAMRFPAYHSPLQDYNLLTIVSSAWVPNEIWSKYEKANKSSLRLKNEEEIMKLKFQHTDALIDVYHAASRETLSLPVKTLLDMGTGDGNNSSWNYDGTYYSSTGCRAGTSSIAAVLGAAGGIKNHHNYNLLAQTITPAHDHSTSTSPPRLLSLTPPSKFLIETQVAISTSLGGGRPADWTTGTMQQGLYTAMREIVRASAGPRPLFGFRAQEGRELFDGASSASSGHQNIKTRRTTILEDKVGLLAHEDLHQYKDHLRGQLNWHWKSYADVFDEALKLVAFFERSLKRELSLSSLGEDENLDLRLGGRDLKMSSTSESCHDHYKKIRVGIYSGDFATATARQLEHAAVAAVASLISGITFVGLSHHAEKSVLKHVMEEAELTAVFVPGGEALEKFSDIIRENYSRSTTGGDNNNTALLQQVKLIVIGTPPAVSAEEDQRLYQKPQEQLTNIFSGVESESEPQILKYTDIISDKSFQNAAFSDPDHEQYEFLFRKPECRVLPEDISCLLYTSGSSGAKPKGAIQTQETFKQETILPGLPDPGLFERTSTSSTARESYRSLLYFDTMSSVFASKTPVHVSSFLYGIASAIRQGSRYAFLPDPGQLFSHMTEVEPDAVSEVPAVWRPLYTEFLDELAELGEKKKSEDALTTSIRPPTSSITSTPGGVDELLKTAQGQHLLDRFRKKLGRRVSALNTGGAKPQPEVQGFLKQVFGEFATVTENYASTEAGPITYGKDNRLEDDVDVQLRDWGEYKAAEGFGEILVHTKTLFQGYLNREDLNQEAFVTLWTTNHDDPGGNKKVQKKFFATGDIGHLTVDKSTGARLLEVIDRKSSFFKLSNGEWVSPEKVEQYLLQRIPQIKQIFVHGDSEHDSVVAVMIPSNKPIEVHQPPGGANEVELQKRSLQHQIERQLMRISDPILRIMKNALKQDRELQIYSNKKDINYAGNMMFSFSTALSARDMKTMLSADDHDDLNPDGASTQLRTFEYPKAFYLDTEEDATFTLQNHLLTGPGKQARPKIRAKYEEKLDGLLEDVARKTRMREDQQVSKLTKLLDDAVKMKADPGDDPDEILVSDDAEGPTTTTATLQQLEAAWEAEIGPNFDSLGMIQLQGKIKRHFGLSELSVRDLLLCSGTSGATSPVPSLANVAKLVKKELRKKDGAGEDVEPVRMMATPAANNKRNYDWERETSWRAEDFNIFGDDHDAPPGDHNDSIEEISKNAVDQEKVSKNSKSLYSLPKHQQQPQEHQHGGAPPINEDRNGIFLTGGSGFLGSAVLRDVLRSDNYKNRKVYALVRPSRRGPQKMVVDYTQDTSTTEGGQEDRSSSSLLLDRLYDVQKRFLYTTSSDSTQLTKTQFANRVIPVEGDLACDGPRLCISDEMFREIRNNCDTFIHSGAKVDHLLPYKSLRQGNVVATREIVKMAGHVEDLDVGLLSTTFLPADFKKNTLLFVSTVSVDGLQRFRKDKDAEGPPRLVQQDYDETLGPLPQNRLSGKDVGSTTNLPEDDNGYAVSKWVGEELVLEAIRLASEEQAQESETFLENVSTPPRPQFPLLETRGPRSSKVLRSGMLGFATDTGAANYEDWFVRYVAGTMQLGAFYNGEQHAGQTGTEPQAQASFPPGMPAAFIAGNENSEHTRQAPRPTMSRLCPVDYAARVVTVLALNDIPTPHDDARRFSAWTPPIYMLPAQRVDLGQMFFRISKYLGQQGNKVATSTTTTVDLHAEGKIKNKHQNHHLADPTYRYCRIRSQAVWENAVLTGGAVTPKNRMFPLKQNYGEGIVDEEESRMTDLSVLRRSRRNGRHRAYLLDSTGFFPPWFQTFSFPSCPVYNAESFDAFANWLIHTHGDEVLDLGYVLFDGAGGTTGTPGSGAKVVDGSSTVVGASDGGNKDEVEDDACGGHLMQLAGQLEPQQGQAGRSSFLTVEDSTSTQALEALPLPGEHLQHQVPLPYTSGEDSGALLLQQYRATSSHQVESSFSASSTPRSRYESDRSTATSTNGIAKLSIYSNTSPTGTVYDSLFFPVVLLLGAVAVIFLVRLTPARRRSVVVKV